MAGLPRPLASIPTTHLIQDRALGEVVLICLGALLSALALASTLFLSSRPVFCPWQFGWSHSPALWQCRAVNFQDKY